MIRQASKKEIEDLTAYGFKYVTRSKHGELVAHKKKPVRQSNFWHSNYERRPLPYDSTFAYVKWSDEPVMIKRKG